VTQTTVDAPIAAATAYEELFVPALFGEWAPRVADAAQIGRGQRVLDLACGTGVLAREAASRVGPTGAVTGLDPNQGMLAVAKRLAPGVDWHQGTAESLPFPDASFDAVISQFGLMFFADRLQALREMRRVLTPGGRVAVAVWDSIENIPAYASEVALLDRVAGPRAAGALRAPFVLGDRNELSSLFDTAGFSAVGVVTDRGAARFPSIRTMVEADLRGWLPVMGVVLTEEEIRQILHEAEGVLSPFVTSQKAVAFDVHAHVVTGTK
jgi:SAM-dependent methyltransferase